MTAAPDYYHIQTALQVAAMSPCRSKRGAVLYDPTTGANRGAGHNGPPALLTCPGRAICAGTCGKRSVHAEVRALREAEKYRRYHPSGPYDLVHVELAEAGGVVACDGPSCPDCAAQILDVGFVDGIWLYEERNVSAAWPALLTPSWHRYSAEEFYTVSMCGVRP